MENHMGVFVRQLRNKLHLTQEELAHALGITVGTVNRWENGRFRPSKLARSMLHDFARKHGVLIEESPRTTHANCQPAGDRTDHTPPVN